MRAFVILSVIAVASAGRLGYNYQPGVSGSNEFISSGSGINSILAGGPVGSYVSGNSGFGGDFGGQVLGSGIRYGINGGSIGSGLGAGINYGSVGQSYGSGLGIGSGSIGSGIYSSGLGSGINYGSAGSIGGGVNYEAGTNRVIDGGLSKEYYIFSAPEEEVHQGHNTQSVSTYLKKNLRVIFIKAPENNGIHNAALQIAKQATEDRTAIYVLSKEPDVSEIATQVQQISENVRAKPEVRFIKYRTHQDALNAQQTIQQQYEALGGSSQSSNEGIAPVLNFASPAAAVHHHAGHSHGISGGSGLIGSGSSISSSASGISSGKSANEYLPPAVKK